MESPHTAAQKQDDQHERTFSSYVRIQVVVLKTYLGRWTIGRSGERGSGISVLPARYDDDDEGRLLANLVIESICFLSTRKALQARSLVIMKSDFIITKPISYLWNKKYVQTFNLHPNIECWGNDCYLPWLFT